VASACRQSTAPECGTREAACDASDCGDCEDIPLIRGVALKQGNLRVDAPAPAQWIGIAPAFTPPAVLYRTIRLSRHEDPDDAAARSTVVLRC
jgi:hypothetical protein